MIPALDAYFAENNLEWLSALVNILLVFLLAGILTRLSSRLARRMAKGRLSRYGQDDTAARRLETGLSLLRGWPSMCSISSPRPLPWANWASPLP